MKIGFILITYKTEEKEIKRLKEEIFQLGFSDYATYIIDNSKNNLGYAKAVNQGLKQALKENCTLLIIINPDISFLKIKNSDILNVSKKFAVAGFAFDQNNNSYYGGEIDRWRMSGGLISKKPAKRYQTVDYVSGSLMIVRKEVLEKVGFLPEEYFMYYEDVDFCYRANQLGFKIGIDSEKKYAHFEQSDSLNLAKKDLLFKNRFRFFWKYASLRQKIRELIRLPKTILEELDFFKRFFLNSNFLVNYLGLNLASLLTKLLNFIWFLVMMRYLSPNEYGIYTLVWAQITLFSPLVDLGTTSYGVVYGHKEKNIQEIISLRLVLGAIVFILVLLTGWLLNKNLFFFIVFASASIFSSMISGGYVIAKALKYKVYHSSIIAFVFNAVLVVCSIIGLVKTKSLQIVFLLIGINYCLQAIAYLFLVKKEVGKILFRFTFSNWKKIISSSYQFVLINLLAQIYFKVDVFLLSALKSNVEVGIYSAGFKFFQTLNFLSSSYTLTSAPKLAYLADGDRKYLIEKVKKDLIFLGIFGFLLAGAFYCLSPLVFSILLKKVYGPSLLVAQITVFALPFILLSSVFFNVLYVIKKINYVIYLFSFQLIFNFVFNSLFIPIYSFYASAWITVISEVVNLLILIVVVNRLLKKKKRQIGVDGGDYCPDNSPQSGIQRLVGNYLVQNINLQKINYYYFGEKRKTDFLCNLVQLPKRFFAKIFLPLNIFLRNDQIFLGFSGFLPRLINTKSIVFLHDFGFYKYPEKYQNAVRLIKQTNYTVKKADKVIVFSDYIKKDFSERFPQFKNKVERIYAGFDHLPKPVIKKPNFKYFLYVGVIKPTKNINYLLQIFSDYLTTTKKDRKLIIIGRAEEEYLKKLEVEQIFKKIKNRIIFRKSVNDQDLVNYYSNAEGLINVSSDEGFCYPVGEGLMSGIPVLVNDLPLYQEYLPYFPNLKICRQEKDFIKEMSQNSKKINISNNPFTWKNFYDQLEKVINQLVM